MLKNHLEELKISIIYFIIQFIIIFGINYQHIHILIYYIFKKLIKLENIYIMTVYEELITNIYLISVITCILTYPLILINKKIYIRSGLYKKEIEKEKIGKIEKIIDFSVYTLIIIPILLNLTFNKNEETIIQMISYGNLTKIIIKLIITWIILRFLFKFLEQRKSLLLIIMGLNIWIIPPDINIQIIITIYLIIRLEFEILNKYWERNLKMNRKKKKIERKI